MKNDKNKAEQALSHWMRVLFYDSLGKISADGVSDITVTSSDGLNVRTIMLENGDKIVVTVDYYPAD